MGHKWLALAFAIAACGSKSSEQKPVPKDAKPEPTPTKSVDVNVAHLDNPVVELPKQESFNLLDPGKGAKSELRYAFAAGIAMYRGETNLKSRRLSGGKWGDITTLPGIRDGFAITIDADPKDRKSVV
jgi:hypothetical protein